ELSRWSRLCGLVGAGISRGCSTPSGLVPLAWDDLIAKLAWKFSCESESTDARLDLLERAEIIERTRRSYGVSDASFADEVARLVDQIDGELVSESNLYPTLRDVGPELNITTNYDRIIERYLNGSTEPGHNVWTYPGRVEQLVPSSYCSTSDRLGDFIRSGEPLIAKIHGGVRDTALVDSATAGVIDDTDLDLVFSFSSYQKAYSAESEIPAALRAIFATYQVVFIGYSLRDHVLRDILQGAGSLKGDRFKHVILQSPESVVPESYREAFQESYGVVVATYSVHSFL